MDVQAITKNVPMSAQKMREVVRQIRGLPAEEARAKLAFVAAQIRACGRQDAGLRHGQC